MLRVVLVLSALIWHVGSTWETDCNDNKHCASGFYCHNFSCRECLDCQELKRHAPAANQHCVTSVVDCGPCLEGLVDNHRGEAIAECVPPDESSSFPGWAWAAIFIIVLLLFVLVAIVIYVLRKNEKISAFITARTSVQTLCATTDPPPTAPELPPPYSVTVDVPGPVTSMHDPRYQPPVQDDAVRWDRTNGAPNAAAVHIPLRPISPSSDTLTSDDESSRPFIKRASPPRVSRPREAAGSQEARRYRRAAYDRSSSQLSGGGQEPSYQGEAQPATPPASVHDEETVMSTWTPVSEPNTDYAKADFSNGGDSNSRSEDAAGLTASSAAPSLDSAAAGGSAGIDLSARLAEARRAVLLRPPTYLEPTNKKKRQDSNNNGEERGAEGAGGVRTTPPHPHPQPPPAHPGHSNGPGQSGQTVVIVNFQQNLTNQFSADNQRNDFSH